jgi:hypothetical protein
MNLSMNPSLSLAPFEKWDIDYIGQISPASSRRNEYIIIATEYLTKWAEAKAVKKADAKQTTIFLYENIISRFGCPKILISDRGSHFLNLVIREMTQLFQINHRKTTPYHPQTNGQTKRVNQTLIRILRKIITESKRDWDVKLTVALWAYRTTYKVTTQATPFSLMYGMEAILSIEFEVSFLCIAIENHLDDSTSLKDRLAWLESLNEMRQLAAQHVEVTQRRRKVAFDKCQTCGSCYRMHASWSFLLNLMPCGLVPTSLRRSSPTIPCNLRPWTVWISPHALLVAIAKSTKCEHEANTWIHCRFIPGSWV